MHVKLSAILPLEIQATFECHWVFRVCTTAAAISACATRQ